VPFNPANLIPLNEYEEETFDPASLVPLDEYEEPEEEVEQISPELFQPDTGFAPVESTYIDQALEDSIAVESPEGLKSIVDGIISDNSQSNYTTLLANVGKSNLEIGPPIYSSDLEIRKDQENMWKEIEEGAKLPSDPKKVAQAQNYVMVRELMLEAERLGVNPQKYAQEKLEEAGLSGPVLADRFLDGLFGGEPTETQRLIEGTPEAIAGVVGELTGLITLSKILKPLQITGKITRQVAKLLPSGRAADFVALATGRAVETGAVFGGKEVVSQVAGEIVKPLVLDEDIELDPVVAARQILKQTVLGSALGSVGAVPNPFVRIPSEGLVGFVATKLEGGSNGDAALTAAMFMAFGIVGSLGRTEGGKFELKDPLSQYHEGEFARVLGQIETLQGKIVNGKIVGRKEIQGFKQIFTEHFGKHKFDPTKVTIKELDKMYQDWQKVTEGATSGILPEPKVKIGDTPPKPGVPQLKQAKGFINVKGEPGSLQPIHEFNRGVELTNDLSIEFSTKPQIVILSAEQLNEAGYDPVILEAAKLIKGDEGYVEGQELYELGQAVPLVY